MAPRKTPLRGVNEPITPEELREWRKEIGWTQAQAANWLGYTEKRYQNWEQGWRDIKRI